MTRRGAGCLLLLSLASAELVPGASTVTKVPVERSAQEEVASDRFVVAGLQKPVAVKIDAWGVPHVEALTLDDAFVAQGFAVARDRLWQMDLWRKRGLG